jgi:hypothetical protein
VSFSKALRQAPRLRFASTMRIDLDQRRRPAEPSGLPVMSNFIFKCPRTGMNVQHWQADEVVPGDPQCTYETVVCQACSRLHFINRSTGKLLGEQQQEE